MPVYRSSPSFKKYGNLLFYNGHEPDYFYFKSLLTYMSSSEAYNARATEVTMQGIQALARPPMFRGVDEDLPALQMLSDAISFLRKAVQYERANEIAFFKQKFTLLKGLFTDKELSQIAEATELQQMFAGGIPDNFDYNRMIVLINILMQGLKETKTIAKYEEDRLIEIDQKMNELNTSRALQLTGLWKSGKLTNQSQYKSGIEFLAKAQKKFQYKINIEYITHGNLSSPLDSNKRNRIWGAKKYLEKIPPTVDVKIAQWITDHINEIFNSQQYMKRFEQLANQYAQTGVANTDTVREMLVKSIIQKGVKHTYDILTEAYKEIPTNDFIDSLMQSIEEIREYKIEGYFSNIGQYGKQVKYFQNQQTNSGKNIAEGLFDAYRSLCKELKQPNRKISKEETYFMNAMKQTGHMQMYNKIIALVNRLEAKEKEFIKLQRQIREGRRDFYEKEINLGAAADGSGQNIIVKVKITADGIIFDGMGIAEGLNQTSLIKSIGNGRSEAVTLKGAIAGLKSKMSHSLRDDLNNAIVSIMTNKNNQKTKSQITTAFEKALTGLKLSIGGPTLSELTPLIQTVLQKDIITNHFPGKINRRTDAVTVTLTYENITLESTFQDIMNTKAEELVEKLDPKLKTIQKQYIADFEKNFYSEMSKLKNTSSEFNDLAKNEEIWFNTIKEQDEQMQELIKLKSESAKLWKEYEAEAKKNGASQQELDNDRIKILNSLQNSFYLSQTMKTYNQYQNDIGFVGPSLGPSVHQQLENLNTLFARAGINGGQGLDEQSMAWLQTAIINCSPVSIVGEKHKTTIENFLSSMAVMAIFDEGAAETTIISTLQESIQNSVATSSPKILHLYRVNTLFVPGSVILERTIEELTKCLDQGSLAIQIATNRGAGVSIVNTMNEGLIPNRNTTSYRYGRFDRDPWGTVGAATDSHVSIKILFLAGLLDIVKSMNKILSDIELPA